MIDSMEKDMEFTPREKYLIHYYKDSTVYTDAARKVKFYELIWISVAIAAVLYSWSSGDIAWGVTGFAIVCGRLIHLTFTGMAFSDELATVIRKYEDKIESLKKTGKSEMSDVS
jgi:hypothetical protein